MQPIGICVLPPPTLLKFESVSAQIVISTIITNLTQNTFRGGSQPTSVYKDTKNMLSQLRTSFISELV